MLLVPCLNCYTVVRVLGEVDQVDALVGQASDLWPDKYVCITCGSACRGVAENEVSIAELAKMKLRELTPAEMLAAQNGLGTPDEMQCDLETVRELLKRPLKKVHGYTIRGTARTCLTELDLEDGTKLYFGSSAHGAVVYRITRPVSYTKKALEETGS